MIHPGKIINFNFKCYKCAPLIEKIDSLIIGRLNKKQICNVNIAQTVMKMMMLTLNGNNVKIFL